MITINPAEISQQDNYKLLIGTIVPRPIAFVTSESNDGIINGAPFSYFNIVTAKPPMISVSVGRRDHMMKDTALNVREKKEFVIHIVDQENLHKVNDTAAFLGRHESEIEHAHLTLVKSDLISTPGIKESKVRFECVLDQMIELGDGDKTSTDLIIGRIVRYHIDQSIYNDGKINIQQLNAMSRLAGADYATIGDIHTIIRPK